MEARKLKFGGCLLAKNFFKVEYGQLVFMLKLSFIAILIFEVVFSIHLREGAVIPA